jgi:signal transduction histidine kinase
MNDKTEETLNSTGQRASNAVHPIAVARERVLAWFERLDSRQRYQELDIRLQEQRGERARLARELHDTLLQGFLGSRIQLHVVFEQMPADSPSRPAVSHVLARMERAIEEGREAVQGLRAPAGTSLNLERALSRVRDEFAPGHEADFRIFVNGKPKILKTTVQDEVYRIGREAIVNAMRHSEAKSIEIEVEYSSRRLRVVVRDNGRGIDPQVFNSERNGQWGLVGMRERAENIGARLRVWSRLGAGTEVELSVPGDLAFDKGSMGFLPDGSLART